MKIQSLITFLLLNIISNAQEINGRVHYQNQPLPLATIRLTETFYHTVTDEEGMFKINRIKPGQYHFKISYTGFQSLEKIIKIQGDTTLDFELIPSEILTDEVVVSATRAGDNSGIAYSHLDKHQIEDLNNGRDIPYLLQLLPSVLATSDAGTGIGYTGLSIRGTDPSRINITINGIPLNDAESQQMYWVDLPDFASSTENIQVQRGAGISTNGASAFGGTVNLLTRQLSPKPWGESVNAFGSFNTLRNNISFGTGLLNNHFVFEGRLSRINSDGYIDRATADLKSFFAGAGYYDEKTIIRLNIFSGKEITYQSWYGVPESRITGNVDDMQAYIDRNGLNTEEADNLLNSGRNYNYYTYKNQVDDYRQDHYQLLFSRQLEKNWLLNTAFHYTHGEGYYEEFERDANGSDFGILNYPDTIESDFIVRRWLKNDFYGTTFSIQKEGEKFTFISGGAWNRYDGLHFGEIIWADFAGSASLGDRYYLNSAIKTDFNLYARTEYKLIRKLTASVDFQWRNVGYEFTGIDANGNPEPQDVIHNFINPKAGLAYNYSNSFMAYASFATANREPNRSDYTESPENQRPKPETMYDTEFGIRGKKSRVTYAVNFYYMDYHNQLVPDGKINDAGNKTRTNIRSSYRSGIEIEGSLALRKNLSFEFNTTLSKNRLSSYTEYTDSYDADFNFTGQEAVIYKDKPIAYSPELIAMARINYKIFSGLDLQVTFKHAGKQYLDNTGNEQKIISPYTLTDFKAGYTLKSKLMNEIRLDVFVNNLFAEVYESNGYTYAYIYDSQRVTENFYYPQALRNFIVQLSLKF